MGYRSRYDISKQVQQELDRLTVKALKKRHYEFRMEHRNDTKELGHSPAYGEVIGYKFICRRFESWEKMLEQVGLPPAKSVRVQSKGLAIYKQEFKRQNKFRKANRVENLEKRRQQKAIQREATNRYLAEKQAQSEANDEKITA